MIVPVSVALALWECVAKTTCRPTITDLSHRWPYAVGVWLWLTWLTAHFVFEARR